MSLKTENSFDNRNKIKKLEELIERCKGEQLALKEILNNAEDYSQRIQPAPTTDSMDAKIQALFRLSEFGAFIKSAYEAADHINSKIKNEIKPISVNMPKHNEKNEKWLQKINKLGKLNIILNEKDDRKFQKFKLTDRGRGYHSIDIVGTDSSLVIESNEINDGTEVIAYKYHGEDNQLWMVVHPDDDDSSYSFRSKADEDMALDVDRSSDPNKLIIWGYHGGENQIFNIEGTTIRCQKGLVFEVLTKNGKIQKKRSCIIS